MACPHSEGALSCFFRDTNDHTATFVKNHENTHFRNPGNDFPSQGGAISQGRQRALCPEPAGAPQPAEAKGMRGDSLHVQNPIKSGCTFKSKSTKMRFQYGEKKIDAEH